MSHKNDLHYLDLTEQGAPTVLVTTVLVNFEGYTKRHIDGAIKSGRLQGMLGNSL